MFLFLVLPFPLSAKNEKLPEAKTETRTTTSNAVVAQSNPITQTGIWPAKPTSLMKDLKGRKNCVKCLRAAGFHVPAGYVRGAGTIPVTVKDISEGEVAVAVTHEGWVGHVVAVQKLHGKLVSVFECNHPRQSGQEVPWTVVKGFVVQKNVDQILKG